ncbi:MAG TPA: DNA-directed RNA polymerase [Byssovorax sp.]|jgi:hypothetical protein
MLPKNLLPILAASLAFVSGCASYVPFTHELRDRHNLSSADLKNLQFYVSTKVTLRREVESGSREITGNHKLLLVSGKQIEEVVLEEKTPGVALEVGSNRILVSFERGSALVFAPPGTEAPVAWTAPRAPRWSDGSNGGFVPIGGFAPANGFAEAPNAFPADEAPRQVWHTGETGPYALVVTPSNQVVYQGKVWDVVDGGANATLMIDAEALDHVETTRKVAPGVRLQ